MKIDGRKIAEQIFEQLKIKVKKLKDKNITPCLAIILVGNDPASIAYVKRKEIKAKEIDAKTTVFNLASETQNSELDKLIKKLNNDSSIHGIIVQQPLPRHIDVKKITEVIDPRKDVDGFNSKTNFQMPITMAVIKVLEKILFDLRGVEANDLRGWLKTKKIAIIGKGETGGKPIIERLRKMNIEPIVIDSKTKNPKNITKTTDIIISAVGKSNIIKADMVKKGAILISIGMHKGTDGKLHGDYEENQIKETASFYTPTPGGVGPVNVAMLLKNVVNATGESNSH